MISRAIDKVMIPFAKLLHHNYMEVLGINNTMKIARAYHRIRYGRYHEYRKNQYLYHFDELIRENGMPVSPTKEIKDGWHLDTSGTLPHLKRLLADAEEIIRERGGIKRASYGRPFFQEIPIEDLLDKYPSFLDFATSSDMLSVVCNYFGFIPVFSGALPYGIRFNESWAKYDNRPNAALAASQLFHLDFHDSPMVYVIVTLKDVTMENGPFCFLPESASKKASEALRYRERGRSYRVMDEVMYSIVPERELIKLCYPAGTVLFLDNSRCFHYGSRNAVNLRYLLMYAYLSTCRTDFGEILMKQKTYPVWDSDSRLRKLVLNREFHAISDRAHGFSSSFETPRSIGSCPTTRQ
ncbi:MAG: hypothetical protein ACREOW_00460 [Thermodesulfobacteriota bacterium]